MRDATSNKKTDLPGSNWINARCFFAAALLLLGACSSDKDSQQNLTETTRRDCSYCHGTSGRSINPAFPNIGGQNEEYLDTQLKTFRDHTRADSRAHVYMWGMAAHLTDATIAELAKYYSSLPPVHATDGVSGGSAKGKAIYINGDESREVPACVTCHGENAEGAGAIPRLAGQNRSYLIRQLTAFASRDRDNDIMHETTKNLTASEIQEISAHLSSQKSVTY